LFAVSPSGETYLQTSQQANKKLNTGDVMNTTRIFRAWLTFGLAANLAFAAAQSTTTAVGPSWLWLIVIPLLAHAFVTLPSLLARLHAAVAGWRGRAGPERTLHLLRFRLRCALFGANPHVQAIRVASPRRNG
jgi:hypothetical protein